MLQIFEFSAVVYSSYLGPDGNSLAPDGATLYGRFSYNPDDANTFGASHYFDPWEHEFFIYTDEGFELDQANRLTNVASTETGDYFTVQSFVSESPNDWHIVFDIAAQNWLLGSSDLPMEFPETFEYAYMNVYFTDEGDWIRTIDATVTSIEPVLGAVQNFAEVGTLSLTHVSTTITLQRTYNDPVVIAFVETVNGNQPVAVRIQEVEGNSLTLQLQEPNYLDERHNPETVNYVVVEAGTWALSDGTIIEAGTIQSDMLTSKGFETVEFDYKFADDPMVLSQVQTKNGNDFVVTRQNDIDADGFSISMQEQESLNQNAHRTETLGWIAVERGTGTTAGIDWLAGRVGATDHSVNSIVFDGNTFEDAFVLASLSSFNGPNTAWVRGTGFADNVLGHFVQEEQSRDAEMWHLPENIDYIAFDGVGLLSGQAYDVA